MHNNNNNNTIIMKRRHHGRVIFLYLTAALLALAAAITGSHAWISMIRPHSLSSGCVTTPSTSNINSNHRRWRCEKEDTTQLYSSGSNGNGNGDNGDDDDDDNNFFSKASKAIKSFLPKQLFGGSPSSDVKEQNNKKQQSNNQIEQQQQQQQQTEIMKNAFSGNLKEILKDAPLGVRMMGEIISPIISGLVETVVETVQEQQRTIDDVIDDAKIYMQLDQSVTDMLGTTTISLGLPISSSSSTSIINGNAQSRIELIIPVYAGSSYSTSTVQVLAINNVITQMELNDSGRRISVSLASQSPSLYSTDTSNISSSSSSKTMNRSNDDDDNDDNMIIEAEIIDKETNQ